MSQHLPAFSITLPEVNGVRLPVPTSGAFPLPSAPPPAFQAPSLP